MNAPETRAERRAAAMAHHRADHSGSRAVQRRATERRDRVGRIAFGMTIVAVLALGGYLAFGDFVGRGGDAGGAKAISVQASMAGFTPSTIHIKAGAAVTLDFWTQDNPMHLRQGVHTMISQELGLYAELPGASAAGTSRVAVRFTAPTAPGTYDIYCDTCCGGKQSPTMHGKVIVDAA